MSSEQTVSLRWLKSNEQRSARLERRYTGLAAGADHCYICGETDPRTFEFNHLFGRANSSVGKTFCANCHRKYSDLQMDLPDATLAHEQKSPAEVLMAIVYWLAFLIEQSALFICAQLRALGQWIADNRESIVLPGVPVLEAS